MQYWTSYLGCFKVSFTKLPNLAVLWIVSGSARNIWKQARMSRAICKVTLNHPIAWLVLVARVLTLGKRKCIGYLCLTFINTLFRACRGPGSLGIIYVIKKRKDDSPWKFAKNVGHHFFYRSIMQMNKITMNPPCPWVIRITWAICLNKVLLKGSLWILIQVIKNQW